MLKNKHIIGQKKRKKKPPLHAYADRICYCPDDFQIILEGHARVIQENNQITATTICYNTKTQRVTTPFQGKQTTIRIQSETLPQRDFQK